MAMEKFRHQPLPQPQRDFDQQHIRQLMRVLEIYFNQLDSLTPNQAESYRAGAFYGGDYEADTIQFDITHQETPVEGKLCWDAIDGTLNLGHADGVVQQIGQETYLRATNQTGVTIANGTVVGFAGSNGFIEVAPYTADGTEPSVYAIGVTTQTLSDEETGFVTVFGRVGDINTTGSLVSETWVSGQILYAHPTIAGGLTNVKPTAPNNSIPIAAVLNVDATEGTLFIRPTIEQQKYYGVFTKTTTQSPAAINTAYALTLDNTEISNGVTIGTPASRLVVPESGLYQVTATVQLSSASSSAKNIWVWVRKNGVDIPNSARIVTVDINGGEVPVVVERTFSLAAGDYLELFFASDSTDVSVDPAAATAFAPAAPAITLSIAQVQL